MNEMQADFGGMHVAAFESRRGEQIAELIRRHGGVPHVCAAAREVRAADDRLAVEFAHRLITGEIDLLVVQTGTGFRRLLDVVRRHVDRKRYVESLADITTIARGPKAAAAMEDVGLRPTYRAPAPNTWREVLMTIDQFEPVANRLVALQEHGHTNPALIASLEARGARVFRIPVYRFELPEDRQPLEATVRALADGRLDVLLVTAAIQVTHVQRVVDELGLAERVRQRLADAVVASVGAVTSEALRSSDWPVDLEAEAPRMDSLVATAARHAGQLRARKRRVSIALSGTGRGVRDRQAPWYDSPFLKACRREPTDVTPVWLMRQAGRYMAEYREVRARTSFLEMCKNPALCSEVMCTAVRRLGVDAAIIFSDLLPILEPMGLELEFVQGSGPVVHNPVREPAEVDRVLELQSVDSLDFVIETVRQTRRDLPDELPLIGFAGAPFTLASYVIEGGASRNYVNTKALMYRDEGAWRALMERFARAVTRYLNAQIAAGAQCVQLFDSWVGCLGPEDYRRFVLPYSRQVIAGIMPGAPVIHFATGNPALVPLVAEAGGTVIGVDWRIGLGDAWTQIGEDRAIQGNLDPGVLLADPREIRARAKAVLDQAAGRPGHIFNLGHGVLPQTPVENAIALVDAVHELSARS